MSQSSSDGTDREPCLDLATWSCELKTAWELRASSPRRDFYVASHVGWNDPATRESQAATDASFILQGLSASFLEEADVLEIGCGNGRLAKYIAAHARRYTGIDISPRLVTLAQVACPVPTARFIESDGVSIPEAARDRSYGLIFAAAVFIHCPLLVIRSLVTASLLLLERSGRFRAQFLADPHDATGIVTSQGLGARTQDFRRVIAQTSEEQAASSDSGLTEQAYYKGHVFSFDELHAFAKGIAGDSFESHLLRIDPVFIYVEFVRR